MLARIRGLEWGMGRSVLIVDDDSTLRMMLRVVLAREGFNVTEAGDGNVALDRIREQPFDLVLMDIVMPGKEGIETILELRQTHPKLPVIAMSGGRRFSDRDPLELALDCGADFIIAKPFLPDKLRALIRRCLPGT